MPRANAMPAVLRVSATKKCNSPGKPNARIETAYDTGYRSAIGDGKNARRIFAIVSASASQSPLPNHGSQRGRSTLRRCSSMEAN
jgi:hypothetical protein